MSVKIKHIAKGLNVILIVLIALAALPVSQVFATSDMYYAGTGTNDPGIGTVAWIDTGNIGANDDLFASALLPAGAASQYLQGTNFGFNIPADATINGIQVTIDRIVDGLEGRRVRDNEVRLLKNGLLTGEDKGGTSYWQRYQSQYVYGGQLDLWGTTWTPAEINDGNFGVALSAINADLTATRTASVDFIQITVWYNTIATTMVVSETIGVYGDLTSFTATITPAVSGAPVYFYLDNIFACANPTDANGVASCNVILPFDVGTYTDFVRANFAGNANYQPSSDTGDMTVNPRPITVTAVTDIKTYDGTTASDGEPTISLGALVPGDTADWSQTFDDENVGTGKTLTPDGTVDDGNNGDNYTVTFVPVNTGKIEALPITVTAVTDTKTYDGTTASDGEPTITLGALVAGDTADWSQTFDDANVGTGKTLTPDGTVDDGNNGDNYAVTFVPVSTGEIVPADQTITVTTHPPASAPNGASFTVAATSSSGLDVTFSASGACSNVGNTFTMTAGTGTCFVHFDQPGNTNYNPAPQVTESVIATTAPLVTLHPEDAVVKPGGNASFTAEASGDPNPTVQWQVSTDGGLTFSDLLGETSTTLLLTTPPLSDNYYQYRAVFTNAAGTDTSDPATLILLYYRQHLTIILR